MDSTTPSTGATTVLVTVSGRDAPGITAQLMSTLALSQLKIEDMGQTVLHGLLSLSFVLKVNAADQNPIKDLLFKAHELGMKLDFQVLTTSSQSERPFHYAVTLLAHQISCEALEAVTSYVAKQNANIETIKRLSETDFSCVEMGISSKEQIDQAKFRKDLLTIANQKGVDIGFQKEGLFRKTKRLVALDMDSTLIQSEVIDEFARERGVYEKVADITREAMKGNLVFDESLRRRVALIEGLTQEQVDNVFRRTELTPGVEELIRVLKKLGYKIALLSGGFTCIADRLRDKLGIDYIYANQLEFVDGRATGKVIPPIVNAQRKADLLDVIAQREQILLEQVIAIGDGANDLPMLEKAGLGIAFNAKPLVREKADLSLNQKNLRSIFYLLGLSARDVQEVL